MPAERINTVNAAVGRILTLPDVKKFLDSEAAEPWPRTPSQLDGFLAKEIERYRKAAQLAGIEPQ
jgi:tripartite-type tricarboxylate transporter receptor subunit TctC